MNRRSIFKLIAGAACAAAMEITGLIPSLPKAPVEIGVRSIYIAKQNIEGWFSNDWITNGMTPNTRIYFFTDNGFVEQINPLAIPQPTQA